MDYAFPSDFLRFGLPAAALRAVEGLDTGASIAAGSREGEGYLRSRYQLPLVWEIVPYAARSSGGTGPVVDTASAGKLQLVLDVFLASGAGRLLTVSLEHSDTQAVWVAAGAYAAKSEKGRESLAFASLKRYVRATWTVAGTTPSFTFGVRFDGDDLAKKVCDLAAYDLVVVRGLSPEGLDHEVVMHRRKEALRWFERLAAGLIDPGLVDSTPEADDGGVASVSQPLRGW